MTKINFKKPHIVTMGVIALVAIMIVPMTSQNINAAQPTLDQKFTNAQAVLASKMSTHDASFPVVASYVNPQNQLEVVIDDKSTSPIGVYQERAKTILGDIPMNVEFGHFTPESCSNQHTRCDPMIGGILISSASGGGTLTVGDNTTVGTKQGFVTVSHLVGCFGTTGASVWQATSFDGGPVGTVITNPSGSRSSDSAFVEFNKDGSGNYLYHASGNKIYSGPNTSYTITAKQDGAADGTAVSMTGFGEQALESGVIQSHGVQISDCSNTLSNQFLASYTHAGGDSGAPVFTTPSGGSTVLVGIHIGDLTVGSVSHAVFSGFGAVQSELGVH
jgi:hypothetical protein